jgi:hypothetical protein
MSCTARTPGRVPRTEGPGNHGYLKGGAIPPEYRIWTAMIQRCHNPTCREYRWYGGRGIRVCPRWREANGFAHFLADVGRRPRADLTLHRQDNDGDYGPGNVEWADRTTQARTRRSNRLLTHDGKTLTVAGWAELRGMRANTLVARLRAGWPVAAALDTPVEPRKPSRQWAKLTPNPKKRGPKPKAVPRP